jgi:hypothetical protein
MPGLTDSTITKVFEGGTGEGQYGPWTRWDVYVDNFDQKLSWFSGGQRPTPTVGLKLNLITYEESQRGKYMNYKVLTAEVAALEKAPEAPKATGPITDIPRELMMLVSYMKDIEVGMMLHKEPSYFNKTASDILQECIDAANVAYLRITTGTVEEQQYEEEPPPPEEPPI